MVMKLYLRSFLLAISVNKVIPEIPDIQDHKVIPDIQDHKEIPAYKDLRDHSLQPLIPLFEMS